MALFEGRPAPPASSTHAQGRIFFLSFLREKSCASPRRRHIRLHAGEHGFKVALALQRGAAMHAAAAPPTELPPLCRLLFWQGARLRGGPVCRDVPGDAAAAVWAGADARDGGDRRRQAAPRQDAGRQGAPLALPLCYPLPPLCHPLLPLCYPLPPLCYPLLPCAFVPPCCLAPCCCCESLLPDMCSAAAALAPRCAHHPNQPQA